MKKLVLLLAAFLSCLGVSAQSTGDLVELGLSVKWCTVNLGADSPEKTGNYYQTGVPTVYTGDERWPYEGVSLPDFEGTDKDAATVALGKGWSTPTTSQWSELMKSCNFEAVEVNGVAGVKITSRINGNYIFLPACGYKSAWNKIDAPTDAYYMTTRKDQLTNVRVFTYINGKKDINGRLYGGRGIPVRPVYVEPDAAEIDLTMKQSGEMSVAVGQTGGDFDFTGFRLTFSLPDGISIESAQLAAGRKTAESTIKISENSEGKTMLTVTNPNNTAFNRLTAAGEEVDSLVNISLKCADGTPDGNYTVTLLSADYYYNGQPKEATITEGNLPLNATFTYFNTVPYKDSLVDLGLSVLWSGINMGAATRTETGDYYQWGVAEVPEKCDAVLWPYYTVTSASDYAGTDKDVATVKLGEGWSTPTKAQWNELINNCTFTQTEVDGVAGYLVTSNLNGQTMFLPNSGYKDYTSLRNVDNIYYMSASFYGRPGRVNILTYSSLYRRVALDNSLYGYYGYPVRPVCVRPPQPEFGPLVVDLCVSDSIEAGAGFDGQLAVVCNSGRRPVNKIELSVVLPVTFIKDTPEVNTGLSKAEVNCEVAAVNATTTKYILTAADGSDFIFTDGDEMTTLLTLGIGCTKYSAGGNYTLTLSDVQFYCSDSSDPEQPETELPIKKTVAVANNLKFDIETDREVDLGLSVNWSGYYVGAELPEQVGDYLVWGYPSVPENENGYNPSKYVMPPTDNWSGMPEYDAATAQWGDDWFTPTLEQVNELMENSETVPYVYNGQDGYALTSKVNGKTIFFAKSGYKQSNGNTTSVYNASFAFTMLADRYKTNSMYYTMYLAAGRGTVGTMTANMGRGTMVRPVKRPSDPQPDSLREINSDDAPAVIYDLQGRRLAAPVRGLQIINNRLIYKK